MEIAISIIVLIITWLVWSRYKTNNYIKEAFDFVEEDKPIILATALREVIRYCQSNNLEHTFLKQEYLIVNYNQKVTTIQRRGNFRTGDCLFFIQ